MLTSTVYGQERKRFIVSEQSVAYGFDGDAQILYLPYAGFEDNPIHVGTKIAIVSEIAFGLGDIATIIELKELSDGCVTARIKFANGRTKLINFLRKFVTGEFIVLNDGVSDGC